MSFGGPQSQALFRRPPSNGSFPIDHDKECTSIMDKYLICLKENNQNQNQCRELAKNYLKCRMEKGLLEQQNLNDLGYLDNDSQENGKNATNKES